MGERVFGVHAVLERHRPADARFMPATQQGFTCLNDPVYGTSSGH